MYTRRRMAVPNQLIDDSTLHGSWWCHLAPAHRNRYLAGVLVYVGELCKSERSGMATDALKDIDQIGMLRA